MPNLPDWSFAAGGGFLIGAIIGWLIAALAGNRQLRAVEKETATLEARLKSQEALEHERNEALERTGERLAATVGELTDKALHARSETFLQLARENLGRQHERSESELREHRHAINKMVSPIAEALGKTESQLTRIERERREAYGAINQSLEAMSGAQEALRSETRQLVTALRRPEVRGQWGEITLRRLAELAGMVEHCDFVEQTHRATEDGAIRPDMIVQMPEQRELIVDAKTPLDAYLEAVEAKDDDARNKALARHARNLRTHVRVLASRRYWEQFEHSPEFVILFIPGDQFLTAALDQDAKLFDYALRQKVILATPTSFVSLLKTIAYGWDQLSLAENAAKIRDLAVTLHKRLGTFTQHLSVLGRHLTSSVSAFNRTVGSLERSVLPGARKFTELGVQGGDLEEPEPVEPVPRELQPPPPAVPAPTDDEPDGRET